MQVENESPTSWGAFYERIEHSIENARTLETASRQLIDCLYSELSQSVVLARVFATLRLSELTPDLQEFARRLARTASLELSQDSFALTLLGTAGESPAWNARLRSVGHQAIPLVSAGFITAIPMMSALLDQMGFDLGWIRGEPGLMARSMGKMAGTFFVEDAATTRDSRGRLVIAAQDFVRQYGVKTVFGFGGGYAIGGRFVVVICFLRQRIGKAAAIRFQSLVNIFKSKTGPFITDPRKIF
jgi:hypothetical protein